MSGSEAPISKAAGAKASARASDIQLGMVKVARSRTAAPITSAAKMPRTMVLTSSGGMGGVVWAADRSGADNRPKEVNQRFPEERT